MIKYCIDCIYCKKDMFGGYYCYCPQLQRDLDGLVNGDSSRLATIARRLCGADGKFFVQRQKNWFQKLFQKKITDNPPHSGEKVNK